MSVKDVFKVYLYADPLIGSGLNYNPYFDGEDITPGILNVDIQYGTDIYEGPQQQIDTGQFTIVTRNPNLDPKINPNLKYNSRIEFHDLRNGGQFFRGYVTNVQVEYQRNDDPIITITGTDLFGAMQRVVISQATSDAIMALSTGPGWNGITFNEFMPYMLDFTSKYLDVTNDGLYGDYPPPTNYGFWFNSSDAAVEYNIAQLNYSPAKYIPQAGETYLDVLNKYATTNLMSFNLNAFESPHNIYSSIGVESFPKYNPDYWLPANDPYTVKIDYDFSSDPADNAPYKTILLDNGFNKVINQLDISNEYRNVNAGQLESTTENFTRTSQESIEAYAISKASVSTIFPDDNPLPNATWATRYANTIFEVVKFPGQQIQQITFDNARLEMIENETTYSFYPLNSQVRIKHQINENEVIDRIYEIAGVSHKITPKDWYMTFTLKPSKAELAYIYQSGYPTLQMNATSGDSNFNFTATLTNYDPSKIFNVYWVLNCGLGKDQVQTMYPYARTGIMFKDGNPRLGTTQTWNFDDDGILADRYVDTLLRPFPYEAPGDNPYGGYGAGEWYVYAYVRFTNDYFIVLQEKLTVGTPIVEADFVWAQNTVNSFGQVAFTDTSVNNETGETDSYLWDFGDGTTSTTRNPIKTYDPAPGQTEYDVSLTVFTYGPLGTKVYNTKTETVTLVQPTMTADFTHAQTPATSTITFTNTSTNVGFEEPDAYLWDFGDGQTSTEKNPVHTYGVPENVTTTFNVTLTTRNIWEQTATVTKTITVTAINASGTFPVRYIKLRIDQYTRPGDVTGTYYFAVTPVMKFIKALTSGTGVNLVYLKPLKDFNDNNIPTLSWKASSGGSPQQSQGWEYYLTRDPSIVTNPLYYGLGAASQATVYEGYRTVRWELVLDLQSYVNTINDIILTFQDLYQSGGTYAGLHIEDFYAKISVDFASTVNTYTPNPAGVYGPPTLNGNWVNVGYFKLDGGRMDPTKPAGQRTEATKTMSKIRPMPLNIPYFFYTFNDKIVSFTSVETADSYLWTFGDGTTSTLKDPVKTYSSYGTYNVTLAVTNGGVVTRTTTEPVIVQAPIL